MLTVNNLSVNFKTENGFFEVVNNVSFALAKGEVIGIVGESGSGKSVTSLAIMRLLEPVVSQVKGEILLDGINLLELPEPQMQAIRGNRVGMIFQEPMTSLNPVLTCGFQVAEAIKLHQHLNSADPRKRAIALFNEVQLPRPEAIFDSYPHEISGGQKQRVMIAMALSCDPEILIADEPTTALDVTVQKTIIELLLRLKGERNMSMVFISHDLGIIGEIADRVIVMYKGQIVEQASIADIFNNPQHPYTKGLLACRPSPAHRLKKLPVLSDFLKFDEQGNMQGSGLGIDELRSQFAYTEIQIAQRKARLYSQQPILQVQNLNAWYPVSAGFLQKSKEFIKAVNNVSFEVYPGETLGLVGESGCGKTTLGRSILRLVEPTSGNVLFDDVNLQALGTQELRSIRKDIQIIFQDPYSALNPRLTVGESIMEPLRVHHLYNNDKERKQKVIQLLERVNLKPEHFNRYPYEFSGGQRQRIVIARALALQPKFIICDESVSALDVSVQAQVLNLLRELQEELKLTYIFISHDLSVVKHIADRIMVMNKGIIEETGDPEQIYYHPQKEYTKRLLDSIPGTVQSLKS
jgi:peptide/nickel transport system ATP-binding protein